MDSWILWIFVFVSEMKYILLAVVVVEEFCTFVWFSLSNITFNFIDDDDDCWLSLIVVIIIDDNDWFMAVLVWLFTWWWWSI